MLFAASLLQWVVWDTLLVIVTTSTDSDRRLQLRQLMENGDCSRPILDSADLRPLLAESVNRQVPYLVVMGRTLASLLAKDRDNDEQHLNETLHSSSVLNSVTLLGVEGSQPLVRIAQRHDQHAIQGERNAADALISTWNYGDVINSWAPGYFLQPNCTADKFTSWTAVISFAVSDRVPAADNEKRNGARRLLLLRLEQGRLDWNVCLADYLTSCDRNVSQCASIAGRGLSLDSYRCCCKYSPAATCVDSAVLDSPTEPGNLTALCQAAELNNTLRNVFLVINAVCAVLSVVMVSLVVRQRKTQQYGARGWALMELFLAGAALLYAIVTVEWLTPPRAWTCCLAVWLRELGFATFYGSIVLKIYRNLQEYRVRKAHHVYVKEQDLLKYLACFVALTATGLMAWTLGAMQMDDVDSYLFHRPAFAAELTDASLLRPMPMPAPTCRLQLWSIAWQVYELLVLLYGVRLCYKARNSSWVERWQFTVAVCLETLVTLTSNIIRFSIRQSPHPDTTLLVSFIQLHLTVTINIFLIMAPKFYFVSQDQTRRTLTMSGSSARAHPSLAKLRDNLVNGTIDFAEVPIADMNPEDIRAELKRVYTQLRMYKLKNIYQDNPHISKRKGGKKSSDKEKLKRRLSIPPASPQTKRDLNRVEEDEKSSMIADQVTPAPFATAEEERASTNDLTVESSPHNIYLARTAQCTSQKLHIEPDQSVRV